MEQLDQSNTPNLALKNACLQSLNDQHNQANLGMFYSIPALAKHLQINLNQLPISLQIVLESVLRHACEASQGVSFEHVKELANWQPNTPRTAEIPFTVARVVLQDFTGIPLLADLAAMRYTAQNLNQDFQKIEPLVPVDLVVDHSVQIDDFANKDALKNNMALEFERNQERYQFMKWAMQAFKTFKVVPPGVGIVHQVNLEYLARGVHQKSAQSVSESAHTANYIYPDTLVGTDSHTTMINGAGVVGWGVGGIEAEAAMLGQPVYFLTPDVVGMELTGKINEGITATDLVLTITEILRQHKVVGQFVEFFGEGVAQLSLPDRATIANMAPEYGATMGFFTVDQQTIEYFKQTGRSEAEITRLAAYFQAQGWFGTPAAGQIKYTRTISLDLSTIEPSLAGPKRPQDRIALKNMATQFKKLFAADLKDNGFAKSPEALTQSYANASGVDLKNGDVLIAAITSCTNTSNPSVLIAAGLLAKKAVQAGLTVAPHIKTSLAPGSRVVTEYLEKAGLLPYLEKLGFYVAAYGCSTCIGNAGDLRPEFNQSIQENDLICAAVLSGNRNFEARIHPNIKANYLASPPLVVAYAIAGNVQKDLHTEALGVDQNGQAIYLKDIWPTQHEIQSLLHHALNPQTFIANYTQLTGELWDAVQGKQGGVYDWPASSYIANPPFFKDFATHGLNIPQVASEIKAARILAIFGDSITTDHISPAGAIKENSPAGVWLKAQGVAKNDFNSYGARRGHHEVMMRGTFANVRIKNKMYMDDQGMQKEGGYTVHQPSLDVSSIYDCAMRYQAENIPSVIFAGEEYGTGSSRDWAAKGTQLLGVKAVIAKSFERIHRANLIGMGVLPIQITNQEMEKLTLDGSEIVSIKGLDQIQPQMPITLVIEKNGQIHHLTALLRVDTPIEVEYYQQGGILPFVLRELLK
jgi:aconitate hydratase